jgi:xanthine dehydrogenase accessory factor
MREIYTEMTEALKRGESFAVATVVATKGSTPRKAGAKMLFFPGGRTVGTIGGGCGEAEVWQEAMAIIGGTDPKLVTVDLTADVEAEDRICGGIMEILVEPVGAGV